MCVGGGGGEGGGDKVTGGDGGGGAGGGGRERESEVVFNVQHSLPYAVKLHTHCLLCQAA